MAENPYSQPESSEEAASQSASIGWTVLKIFGVGLIGLVLLALLLPFNRGREPARRTQCKYNLKQIGLALHNYHDVYEAFPPAYTVNSDGHPLHSWRTLILPFMEQQALYDSIDLSKPWSDPVNRAAFESNLQAYRCPSSDVPDGHTTYLGVTGPNSVFYSTEAVQLQDITDGTSNTLLVMEVPLEFSVHWMAPHDADRPLVLNLKSDAEKAHLGGAQALFGDGSVRFLSKNIALETLEALVTINGGETVGEF